LTRIALLLIGVGSRIQITNTIRLSPYASHENLRMNRENRR